MELLSGPSTVQGDCHTVASSARSSRSAFSIGREYCGCRLSRGTVHESPVILLQRHLENTTCCQVVVRVSVPGKVVLVSQISTRSHRWFPVFSLTFNFLLGNELQMSYALDLA